MVDGFHVPVNPLSETVGSGVGVAFRQNGPIGGKLGGVKSFIVIVVVQLDTLHPSEIVQVIVEVPMANAPLASFPLPLLLVAPVI